MTQEEIFTVAFKCGIIPWTQHQYIGNDRMSAADEGLDGDAASLLQFAHQLMAIEREECAKLCDKQARDKHESDSWTGCAQFLSNNIRARGMK